MNIVILTATGVGCATVIGAIIGLFFKQTSHKFGDVVLAFASGIMLCAAVFGLIQGSLEQKVASSIYITIIGIFLGAALINFLDKIIPHLHRISGVDTEKHSDKNDSMGKVILFVTAIAIHNLPEGIASGVGFGTGNTAEALTIAGGIALQNIPEGMVIIAPMLSVGMSKKRTFAIAAFTGIVEIIGTFIGYFAVSISSYVLPFALAFAGGTMLYVISDEMIPETHSHGNERASTYALLLGFSVMLLMDYYIG